MLLLQSTPRPDLAGGIWDVGVANFRATAQDSLPLGSRDIANTQDPSAPLRCDREEGSCVIAGMGRQCGGTLLACWA